MTIFQSDLVADNLAYLTPTMALQPAYLAMTRFEAIVKLIRIILFRRNKNKAICIRLSISLAHLSIFVSLNKVGCGPVCPQRDGEWGNEREGEGTGRYWVLQVTAGIYIARYYAPNISGTPVVRATRIFPPFPITQAIVQDYFVLKSFVFFHVWNGFFACTGIKVALKGRALFSCRGRARYFP